MSIIQDIEFKTQNGIIIKSYIEQISKSEFNYHIHADSEKETFYLEHQPFEDSSNDAFNKLFLFINKVISSTFPNDKILKINNPCNCEYISKIEQAEICGNSISITVNN